MSNLIAVKKWWHAHKVVFLSSVAVFAYLLGLCGYSIAFNNGDLGEEWLSAPYMALKTFLLDSDDSFGIWQLEVARWLAPVVTSCTAIVGVGALFTDQLKQYRLRSLSGHVVICGLGRKGMQLVREYNKARRDIVVIELDENNDHIESCKELGAYILCGDATENVLHRKACTGQASDLIATCSLDRTNIQVALQAWSLHSTVSKEKSRQKCAVHIGDHYLNFLFKQHDVFRETTDAFEVTTFNYTDLVVRKLLSDFPMDYHLLVKEDARQIHLIISGFGKLGQALALYAAKIGHYANLQRLRITMVDPNIKELTEKFCARYPKFAHAVEMDYISADIGAIDTVKKLQTMLDSSSQITTLALCSEDIDSNLPEALQLCDQLSNSELPIRLFQPEGGNLEILFKDDHQLTLFGGVEECITPNMIFGRFDNMARIVHEDYVKARLYDTEYPEEPESRPALLPWSRLRSDFRDSNRQQADHIPVKLRVIDAVMEPITEDRIPEPFVFTGEEVELLARIEHNRWNVDRWLSGWDYGPERDNDMRIHPSLLAWDELGEKIRDLDRETVRNIPKMVALAGCQIVRNNQ